MTSEGEFNLKTVDKTRVPITHTSALLKKPLRRTVDGTAIHGESDSDGDGEPGSPAVRPHPPPAPRTPLPSRAHLPDQPGLSVALVSCAVVYSRLASPRLVSWCVVVAMSSPTALVLSPLPGPAEHDGVHGLA